MCLIYPLSSNLDFRALRDCRTDVFSSGHFHAESGQLGLEGKLDCSCCGGRLKPERLIQFFPIQPRSVGRFFGRVASTIKPMFL